MEGKILNGYAFSEKLGEGSFGKVWKASKGKQVYAIKSIELSKKEAVKTAEMEQYFINIKLNSPFVIDYIDAFKSSNKDFLYIVMEYCSKGDLDKFIAKLDYRSGAAQPKNQLMRIIIQLVLGADVLQHNKILHRDIKAGNVLFNSEDELKISDFGCGTVLEETMGQASSATGTRHYLAPEVYRGLKYGYPADIWSLGVLLYYLCVGRLPFQHPNQFQIGDVVKEGKYIPIPKLACPKEVQVIIGAILQQNPQDRPTALAILQHPFIQGWADELGLKKYFPKEAKKPLPNPSVFVLAGGHEGEIGTGFKSGTGTDTGTGMGGGTPKDAAVEEFMRDTAAMHPEYTVVQFKQRFNDAKGRNPTLAEINRFRKMQSESITSVRPFPSATPPESLTGLKSERERVPKAPFHPSPKSLIPPKTVSLPQEYKDVLSKEIIDGYTVSRVQFGSGNIYKCVKDGCEYAIKRLDEKETSYEFEINFLKIITLHCRFLVRYFHTFRDNKNLYIVMELCPKRNLREVIVGFKNLGAEIGVERVMKIFVQLLIGLETLHSSNVIHGNLKPENILTDKDDNIKIGGLYFGISVKFNAFQQADTTPMYVSPEMILGEHFDTSADMWALGVVLYELCTLEWPFSSPNKYFLHGLILKGEYAPILEDRCPDDIRNVVDSLLSVDCKSRPTALSLLSRPFIRMFAVTAGLLVND